MKSIFLSKKVIVSLVGLVIALAVSAGLIAPEQQDTIITAIVAIIGSFNIGQGIADGLSKGQTSARSK